MVFGAVKKAHIFKDNQAEYIEYIKTLFTIYEIQLLTLSDIFFYCFLFALQI